MRTRIAYPLYFVISLAVTILLEAQTNPGALSGGVVDANGGKGIPNLTARLIPPKDTGAPELVSFIASRIAI